jgi:hypothetical protein
LRAHFALIFWRKKIAKPNVTREKLLNWLLHKKTLEYNVDEIDSRVLPLCSLPKKFAAPGTVEQELRSSFTDATELHSLKSASKTKSESKDETIPIHIVNFEQFNYVFYFVRID